jgi:hypothetical protein
LSTLAKGHPFRETKPLIFPTFEDLERTFVERRMEYMAGLLGMQDAREFAVQISG